MREEKQKNAGAGKKEKKCLESFKVHFSSEEFFFPFYKSQSGFSLCVFHFINSSSPCQNSRCASTFPKRKDFLRIKKSKCERKRERERREKKKKPPFLSFPSEPQPSHVVIVISCSRRSASSSPPHPRSKSLAELEREPLGTQATAPPRGTSALLALEEEEEGEGAAAGGGGGADDGREEAPDDPADDGREEALDDPAADDSSLRSGSSLSEGTAVSLNSGRVVAEALLIEEGERGGGGGGGRSPPSLLGGAPRAGFPPPPSPPPIPKARAESLTEARAESTPTSTAASRARSPPLPAAGLFRSRRSCCSPRPSRGRLLLAPPHPASKESLAVAAESRAEAAERGVNGGGERGVAGWESETPSPLLPRARVAANAAANSARLPPAIALPFSLPPLLLLGVAAAEEEECRLLSLLPPCPCSWRRWWWWRAR